jgi:sirohydrochlorin ferrochelatase
MRTYPLVVDYRHLLHSSIAAKLIVQVAFLGTDAESKNSNHRARGRTLQELGNSEPSHQLIYKRLTYRRSTRTGWRRTSAWGRGVSGRGAAVARYWTSAARSTAVRQWFCVTRVWSNRRRRVVRCVCVWIRGMRVVIVKLHG